MADILEGNSSDEDLGELEVKAVQRRHFDAGVRRGRTVGSEAALQRVFNSSYGESYKFFYRCGVVLGSLSALSSLPLSEEMTKQINDLAVEIQLLLPPPHGVRRDAEGSFQIMNDEEEGRGGEEGKKRTERRVGEEEEEEAEEKEKNGENYCSLRLVLEWEARVVELQQQAMAVLQ